MGRLNTIDLICQRLETSTFLRHVYFGLITTVAILFLGYHFGTFDQVIHIPFLKKFADPTLYGADPFLQLRYDHYSYFWHILRPLWKMGVLEPTLFILHIAATYATVWALWRLSYQLFKNTLVSAITVLCLTIPHLGFAGFTLLEFSLLNRTFVLPFLIFAIELLLTGRIILSLLLLSVMYNLHVVSVNFVLAMFMGHFVLRFRTAPWSRVIKGMFIFFLAASPVLLWKLTSTPVALTRNSEWFRIISQGMLPNLFYLFSTTWYITFASISGFAVLGLYLFSSRKLKPIKAHYLQITNDFVLVACALVALAQLSSWIYPSVVLVQFQIIRAGVFLLIFAYIYAAAYIASEYKRTKNFVDLALLVGAFVASTSGALLVITFLLYISVKHVFTRRVLMVLLIAGYFGVSSYFFFKMGLQDPTINIYPKKTHWYSTQIWAKEHTPKDTVFITPPDKFWFYEPSWRVHSERGTVVDQSELLEIAFYPPYTSEWVRRFDDLAPGARAQFHGDIFDNLKIVKSAYYNNGVDDLKRIGAKYSASYLVVEKPHFYNLPKAYENEEFIIYTLDKR